MGGGLWFNIERISARWRALMADFVLKQGVFHRFCLIAPPQDSPAAATSPPLCL